MKIFFALAITGIVLASCAPTPQSSTSNESGNTEQTTTGLPEPNPATPDPAKPVPSTGGESPDTPVSNETGDGSSSSPTPSAENPSPGNPGGGSNPSVGTEGAQKTPPTTTKWNRTDVDPKVFAKLMDQTIHEMESTVAEFRVLLQNKKGAGTDQGRLMVANRSKFYIESFRMHQLGRICKDVADGSQRMSLSMDGWSDSKPLAGAWTSDNEPIADQWWNDFPRLIFRPLLEARPVWLNLVRDLKTAGYTVSVNSNEQMVNGKVRPFYQLLAKPKNKVDWTMECRVDGIRRLPLTIRLIRGVDVRQWSASWGFDQPVNEKSYQLPKKADS